MFNFFGDGGHNHGGGGFPGHQHEPEDVDTEKMYDILGVKKDASGPDIKKAFRKQAMKHHPDKGGDADKFKEVNKANEILSDPEKRALYDRHGEKGVEQGGGGGGGDPSDIFSSFFGGGGGGGGRGRGPRKGKDVLFRLKVSLDDLYNGATKKLRLTKQCICKDCKGKGGEGIVKCGDCKGRGVRVIIRQLGPGMIQQMQAACDACEGQGEVIPPGSRCKGCQGEKTVKEKKTLEVHVEKGMVHGQKVVFRGESDESPGIQPGDVIVVLEQAEHDYFVRKLSHLFYKKKISLVEALTGFSHYIEQMDGRVLKVESDPDTVYSPGCVKCVRDEGMPQERNQMLRGHMYIEYDVEFPAEISEPMKKQLLACLPKSKQEDVPDGDVEEVMLSNVNMDHEKIRWREEAGNSAQNDEDQEGPQQASCRAQ